MTSSLWLCARTSTPILRTGPDTRPNGARWLIERFGLTVTQALRTETVIGSTRATVSDGTTGRRTVLEQLAEAAVRVARGEDDRDGARKFGTPPPSPMFALAPTRRPGLAWNHARTHRVEALPGGVTVFNLNDHCAIALLWVVPFFGCQIGKIPARGDLFEHMRDAPGPDLH